MNISEEKIFIYEMMREVTKERRELTSIYFDLKKRLDDLIELEQRGLEDLSLEGYVDLYNKLNKKFKSENVRREANNAINMIHKTVEKIESEQRVQEENLSNSNDKPIIPQEEIDRVKQIDRKKEEEKSGRKRGKMPKGVYDQTIMILKEEGIPLPINEIREKLEDKFNCEISRQYLTSNVLYRLKKEDKIDNPTRGIYQYKF